MSTVEELENLYSEEKTVRGEELVWKFIRNSYRLEATVLTAGGTELLLRATHHKAYSFVLLHRKTQLIRRWDTRRHRNPDGTIIVGPHKHKPTTSYGKDLAYNVDDVPQDNLEAGLLAFLKECNINVEGTYQHRLF